MTVEPQVFLSYVHDDDETFNGAVGKLRKRLENAYKTANGSKLRVFFDKDGIEWSMPWLDRLDIALADSWFLIPIVTPAYIESEQCCREFKVFLEIESRLNRNDLILPLVFFKPWQLEDDNRKDVVVTVLRKRQWRDWCAHAYLDPNDTALTSALLSLASELGNAVRNYSVLSALAGFAPPPSPEEPSELPASLKLAASDALARIGITSFDDVTLEIVLEAAKLKPEPGFKQPISWSRIFCGTLVVGRGLSAHEPTSGWVYALAQVLQKVEWQKTREENLARFRYDTGGSLSRLRTEGFSVSPREGLRAAVKKSRLSDRLTGNGID
jgi:TIR domain